MKADDVRDFAKASVGQAVELIAKQDLFGAQMKLMAANIFLQGEACATMKEYNRCVERIAQALERLIPNGGKMEIRRTDS